MTPDDRQALPAERERLIESHLPLVRAIARRYAGRGETLDDLVQVGSIGLIRASDRFDPDRGVAFATFATPAIEGEIRRHLGDRTTSLRIPRELQRISGRLQRARAQLGASLGRDPTVDELATALGVAREDVERALEADRAREAVAEPPELDEVPGAGESAGSTDDRVLLALAARALNERERRIVFLRFHADMTERDIATELRISQAQVSRSLAAALAKLREELDDENQAPAAPDISDERVISPEKRGKRLQRGMHKRRKPAADRTTDTRIAGVGASRQRADRAAADAPRGKREQSSRRKAGPSGRFLVRMPSDLHQELTVAAEREQVSLNRYVTDALAASVSESEPEFATPGEAAADPRPAEPTVSGRRRSFRVLVAANVIVMLAAAAAAIALLILALERGI